MDTGLLVTYILLATTIEQVITKIKQDFATLPTYIL